MKKSTIALITAVTLLALHGSHMLWGLRGWIGFAAMMAMFFLITRTLYWRRLRRLQRSARGLAYEERRVIYTVAGLDAEARRDMEKLIQDERESANRSGSN